MKYEKYYVKDGDHGPIYRISRGITVRKNNRDTWVAYIEKGTDRKNISFGRTDEDLKKAIEMSEEIAQGFRDEKMMELLGVQKEEEINFKEYSTAWLENNAQKWNEKTLDRYESILRLFILPEFSDATLQGIKRVEIKRFLQKLLMKRSPATVGLIKDVFSGIFEDAIEEELIASNPTDRILKRILPPKFMRRVTRPDPFTKDELELFIHHAEEMPAVTWSEVLILKVMGYAGFRLGESLAMRLENFDFKSRNFYVCESFKSHKFSLPKKGKTRLVDLPKFLIEEFHSYVLHLKKEGLKNGTGGDINLLFIDPKDNGYPFSQRKIQMLMKRVCKSAGMRVRHPHDLRHTYATICLMSGMSPAYVQKQLGHYSIQMTVDVYGHWIPGEGRGNLDEVFMTKENPKEVATLPG
jgi:integrase